MIGVYLTITNSESVNQQASLQDEWDPLPLPIRLSSFGDAVEVDIQLPDLGRVGGSVIIIVAFDLSF